MVELVQLFVEIGIPTKYEQLRKGFSRTFLDVEDEWKKQ